MKIVKSLNSGGSATVKQDIEQARMRMIYEDPAEYAKWRMRMIYEDPAEYAKWRLRMGLQPPAAPPKGAEPDPHGDAIRFHMARLDPVPPDNPVMRARVGKLFRELGSSMEPPRSKRRPGYQPVESLAEYGRQPLAVSDAFKATLRRPEAAE